MNWIMMKSRVCDSKFLMKLNHPYAVYLYPLMGKAK